MKYWLPLGLCMAMLPNMAVAAPLPDVDLDPAERVILLCDAAGDRLHIRAIGDHDDDDRTYPKRTVIAVADFIGMARGQYRTFQTRSYQCGSYAVTFSGDALNSNIQGELGAEPAFLSVRIARGKVVILESRRLVVCETGDPSPRRGQCPSDYATRVNVKHEAGRSVVKLSSMQIADAPDSEYVTTNICAVVPDGVVATTQPKAECGK